MKTLYAFIILIVLVRCGKDVPAPTYLKIDHFTLLQNPDVNVGQLTHNFIDVYVYIDDNPLGVFPVPCVIPVNYEGFHKVTLMPAVRKSGQSGLKTRYPFVEHHIEQVDFVRLDTMHIQPVTKYYSTTQVWYEDFEDATVKFQSTNLSMVNMVKSSNPDIIEPRNQSFFGLVNIDETNTIWDAMTTDDWALTPGPQREFYIELDFYIKNSMQSGLQSSSSAGINSFGPPQMPFMRAFRPDETRWKKIYIDIKDVVGLVSFGSTFKFKLTSILDPENTEAFIAVDNIKLIYR